MNYIGLKPLAYYVGNFIFDYILFLIPTLGFLILLFPMKIEAFNDAIVTIMGILLCFGVPLVSLTYLCSFMFSKAATAFR